MRGAASCIETERDGGADRADRRAGCRCDARRRRAHLADQVLFATGRLPNTAGLGLEALGVGIAGTARSRSTAGRRPRCRRSTRSATSPTGVALTPVAIREAHAFAETVFGGRPTRFDHALIPTAVFTQPEIGDARPHRGRGAGAGRGRDLSHALPADAAHARRTAGADADEARGRRGQPAGARLPYRRPWGGRDDPARGGRDRHGRDQGGFRPDAGGASDGGRGAGHHARSARMAS